MGQHRHKHKKWRELVEVASTQHGCFTLAQASTAGFSSPLLCKYLHDGDIARCHRGIYRLANFRSARPGLDDLQGVYLWSKRLGVFSHATACYLHRLSDHMPTKIHLTLPLDQADRQLTAPPRVRLYWADMIEFDWMDGLPVSKPIRTLFDIARAHGDSRMLDQARRRMLQQQLASFSDLDPIVAYLGLSGSGLQGENVDGWAGIFTTHVLTGICVETPSIDWLVTAEELAEQHGAKLLRSSYYPGSNAMLLAFAWPAVPNALASSASVVEILRTKASDAFQWKRAKRANEEAVEASK